MNDEVVFNTLIGYLHTHYGAQINFKNESLLMKFLGKVLFFNPGFMTEYITTIGKTIYFPSRKDLSYQWPTLAHEGMHLHDSSKEPVRYALKYLFPQVLALGSLLAFLSFLSPWFLLFLAFLIFLLPLPATYRMRYERRAYNVSTMCVALQYGIETITTGDLQESMVDIYTGWGYYKMHWVERSARDIAAFDCLSMAAWLTSGTAKHPYLSDIREIVEGK